MDDLVRLRRALTRAQLDFSDRVIGWLVLELQAIHRLDRTSVEQDTLRQLEILRVRLRADD